MNLQCITCKENLPKAKFSASVLKTMENPRSSWKRMVRCRLCANNKAKASYQRAKSSLQRRFSYVVDRAIRYRKLSWEISFTEWVDILAKTCYYCKESLFSVSRGSSLDRIDNDKGYTKDNVVGCCTRCNRIRGDNMTSEEALQVIQYLLQLRSLKRQVV